MVSSSFVFTWWCSIPLSLCGRGLRGGGTRKNPHQKKREEEGQSRHNKERGLRNPLTPHQKREGVSVLRWLRVCVLSQTHFEPPCICRCGGLVHTSKVGKEDTRVLTTGSAYVHGGGYVHSPCLFLLSWFHVSLSM